MVFFALFISTVGGVSAYHSDISVAFYTLSFWHYYVYLLAYRFRAVPLSAFKRDAIAMKCVSLAILGWAFFSGTPDIISMSVSALGFALNAYSAVILGSDRSYYGYELGGIAYHRITSFPYSMLAHPMLIGNIVAFSGTLINADFRENWSPLAVTHAVMNVGLLFMETTISADSRSKRFVRVTSVPAKYIIGITVVTFGAAIGYATVGPLEISIGILLGVITSTYALVLFSLYSTDARENAPPHTIADGNAT